MTSDVRTVELSESTAWSAEGRGGPVAVEVLEGTVLVTMERDRRDRVLSAGERFLGLPRRRVAAAGLGPSRIRVTLPRPAPLARFAARAGGRQARHLLGGALIVAVWLSLWAWMAAQVAAPLAAAP